MSVFDLLTHDEKELWLKYTAYNTEILPHTERADIKTLLREWAYQKDKFLGKLFNDSLIISEHIVYKMDVAEKIEKLCNSKLFCMPFLHAMNDWNSDTWRGLNWEIYWDIHNLLNVREYYAANKYTGQTIAINYTINDPVKGNISKTLKIQSGCKLMKALGTLYHTFQSDIQATEEDLINFQNEYSICVNDTNLEGDMCVSIHPLDYVTVSDNECGWRSCMNWRHNGEYHRGTIEMMNSSTVVVVYLTSQTPMSLLDTGEMNDDWSNKKWREYFIVTPTYIVPIKGYPYKSRELEKIAINLLIAKMTEKNLNEGAFHPIETIELGKETAYGRTFYFGSDGAMYDDFGSLDDSIIAYTSDCAANTDMCFNGISTCIWCGEANEFEEDCEGDVICTECQGHSCHCCICGDRLYGEEYYWVDGEVYCEDCYYDSTSQDAITGERHHNDSMYNYRVMKDNKITSNGFTSGIPRSDSLFTKVSIEAPCTCWDFWDPVPKTSTRTYTDYVLDYNTLLSLQETDEGVYNRICEALGTYDFDEYDFSRTEKVVNIYE